MIEKLHWLGHDAFRLEASKTIYFDPFKLSANAKKADIILVSHEHFDHYSPADIALISTKDTVIVADKVTAGAIRSSKLLYKEAKVLSPQEEADIAGVKVKAVAAYNIGKNFHTKESVKLGYLVTVDGVTFYHAGDTDLIPEMKSIKADVALLPVSGTYVMTADEAAQAALAINPGIAIPMHYGAGVVGSIADAQRFETLLKGKIKTKLLTKEE
jgi:L-ascorbate metabolism protein UlaG (beta-lactamase superfamily)